MHKILVLTSTFPRWQNDCEPPFVFDLCKQLTASFDVHVLAPHSPHALDHEIMHNIKVSRFRYCFERFETLCYQGGILGRLREKPLRCLLIPFFAIAQLIAAYRLIKLERISIIHAHWIIPQGLIAVVLRYVVGQPLFILCTSHGADLFSLKGIFFKFIKRITLLNVNAISVVSPIMTKEVYSICSPYKPKLSVIPMGIDFNSLFTLSTVKKNPFSLLFVGRLVEKKGVSYLINAMPAILEKFPKAHLTIIGDGPERNNLNNLVNTLQLHKNIHFTGSLLNTELPIYYQKNLIAIFPFIVADNGDREGLGLVIPEAIGCGCCVVTTNLPGMEHLITHNYNGFIIKQKSSQAISNEIIRLFSDNDAIQNIKSTALTEITTNLDSNIIGNKYKNLLQSLIQ